MVKVSVATENLTGKPHFEILDGLRGIATKPSTAELTLVVFCGTIFLIAFAYLAQVLYDVPVRNYLARKSRL